MSEAKVFSFLGGPTQSMMVYWSSELDQGSCQQWPENASWQGLGECRATTTASWQGLGDGKCGAPPPQGSF